MSKTRNVFLTIKRFERKCHDEQLKIDENKRIWDNLDFKQEQYGEAYRMTYRFLRKYGCPNCNTSLNKKFMFKDDEGYKHYIYSCSVCEYKYARSYFER